MKKKQKEASTWLGPSPPLSAQDTSRRGPTHPRFRARLLLRGPAWSATLHLSSTHAHHRHVGPWCKTHHPNGSAPMPPSYGRVIESDRGGWDLVGPNQSPCAYKYSSCDPLSLSICIDAFEATTSSKRKRNKEGWI